MTCQHSHDAIRNGMPETVLCTRETSGEDTLCDVHGRPCACGNSIPVESDESLCEDCDATINVKD